MGRDHPAAEPFPPARTISRFHHHLLRAGRAASTPRWTSQTWITPQDLGLPGEYPFTRGIHPTLHRSRLWTMRMFAGFGTAEETNQRFKYLLDQGQTGLSIAFDLPTLMGYDTDCPGSAWASSANAAWQSPP